MPIGWLRFGLVYSYLFSVLVCVRMIMIGRCWVISVLGELTTLKLKLKAKKPKGKKR